MSSVELSQWTKNLEPYWLPPAAAFLAVNPFVFYGFVKKSAKQLAVPVASMTLREFARENVKMASTVGLLVGAQFVSQEWVKEHLLYNEQGYRKMLASSMLVGIACSPILAVFNGLSMKLTFSESCRRLSVKQVGAIIVQETIFLFSKEGSEPVNKEMNNIFGEKDVVRYGSSFVTGAFGALCNHPANTTLTFLQNDRKFNVRHLMRGCFHRALSVGTLLACFEVATDVLKRR